METLKHVHGLVCHCKSNYLNNLDRDYVKECRDRYKIEHEKEPYSRPTAILNLLGFCAWKLKNKAAAKDYFKKTLEVDKNNLNALMNLVFINKELSIKNEAKFFDDRIKEIISDEGNLDFNIAYYYYEHATAMTCVEEFNDAVKYFELALRKAGDKIDNNEKLEWNFALGFLYKRMDSSQSATHVGDDHYKKGVQQLYEVIKGPSSNTESKLIETRHEDRIAKAWAFICSLLSHQDRKKLTLEEVIGSGVLDEHKNLDCTGCQEKAEEKSLNTAVGLQKLGKICIKGGKMEKAKEYFEKALEIKPATGYTHLLLGQWYLTEYVDKKDAEDLKKAIEYLENAKYEYGCNLFDVYYDLARAYKENKELDQAVAICSECAETRNGKHCPKLFKLWGKVLREKGEDGSVEDARAKALERGDLGDPKTKDFGAVYYAGDDDIVRSIVLEIEDKLNVDGYYFSRDKEPGRYEGSHWEEMLLKSRRLLVFVSKEFVEVDFLAKRVLSDEEIKVIPIRIQAYTGKLPFCMRGKVDVTYDPDNTGVFLSEMKNIFSH